MKNLLVFSLSIFLTFSCWANNGSEAQNTNKSPALANLTAINNYQNPTQKTLPPAKPIQSNFLTHDKWSLNSIVASDEALEKLYDGITLEIREDGYFSIYKNGSNEIFSGVFRLDLSTDRLVLYPRENEEDWGTSEWKVQYNGSMVVLTGTATYRDNGTILLFHRAK